jgi:deazaflavin-dependent oxidoreductase (nitroreductase family)
MPLNGEYEPSTSDWARENAELYMSSGGTAGTELKGKPVVLLTTVGAKTGKIRKTPLMRVEHNGEYAIVASMGGAPKHPVWYHNIVAHPRVELQDGTANGDYEAREVFGEEKALWWQRAVEVWPDYADYQRKTDARPHRSRWPPAAARHGSVRRTPVHGATGAHRSVNRGQHEDGDLTVAYRRAGRVYRAGLQRSALGGDRCGGLPQAGGPPGRAVLQAAGGLQPDHAARRG